MIAQADRLGIVRRDIVEASLRRLGAADAGVAAAVVGAGRPILAIAGRFVGCRAIGLSRRVFTLAVAVKQRIAFEFRLDISREVEVGELQQLDGLHRLRRHH